MNVAAILTVHNRRELTLRCLGSVMEQRGTDAKVTVFMCDDGSTDGTSEAVADQFDQVAIVPGDGNLFYSGGMRAAWQAALPTNPDAFWLLNDDVELDETALRRLLMTHREVRADREVPVLIVGSTRDAEGNLTYGGVVQQRVRRMRFTLIEPGGLPRPADTMNGNCVLVPRDVGERVGMIDGAFRHSMGDYDYGLRARQMGCEVWVAPGTIGVCAGNPGFVPEGRDVRSEWKRLRSVRNLPPAQWRTFTSRWGGPVWPVLWAFPYARRLLRIIWAATYSLRKQDR